MPSTATATNHKRSPTRARFRFDDQMTCRVEAHAEEWRVSFSEATRRLSILASHDLGRHLWLLVQELAIMLEPVTAHPFAEAAEAASRVIAEHSRLTPLDRHDQRRVLGNVLGAYRTNAAKAAKRKAKASTT